MGTLIFEGGFYSTGLIWLSVTFVMMIGYYSILFDYYYYVLDMGLSLLKVAFIAFVWLSQGLFDSC